MSAQRRDQRDTAGRFDAVVFQSNLRHSDICKLLAWTDSDKLSFRVLSEFSFSRFDVVQSSSCAIQAVSRLACVIVIVAFIRRLLFCTLLHWSYFVTVITPHKYVHVIRILLSVGHHFKDSVVDRWPGERCFNPVSRIAPQIFSALDRCLPRSASCCLRKPLWSRIYLFYADGRAFYLPPLK